MQIILLFPSELKQFKEKKEIEIFQFFFSIFSLNLNSSKCDIAVFRFLKGITVWGMKSANLKNGTIKI